MSSSKEIIVNTAAVLAREKPLLDKYESEYLELMAELEDEDNPFKIRAEDDYKFATELLTHAKSIVKDLKSRQKASSAPLTAALNIVKSWYRKDISGWECVEAYLKELFKEHALIEDERRTKALEQVTTAAIQDDFDAAHEASKGLTKISAKGVSTSFVWEVDIDNVDLSKVPVDYLALNLDAAKAYIKSFGKSRPKDLPGIPFKKAVRVVGSTR